MTLTATDSVGSDTDSLRIDVYDDECEAALGDGEQLDPSDVNYDCATDLADIGEMSAMWDYDYALIVTVPKPL